MYRYRLFLRRYRQQLRAVGFVAVIILIFVLVIYWVSTRGRVKVVDFNSCITAGYDPSSSDPQTCSDGQHTYVAPGATAVAATPPAQSLQPYTILVESDTKGDYPQRQQVVTTAADWANLWKQLYAKLKPTPPLLPVDFTKDEVIVLTYGVQASGGYGFEVSGVSATSTGATLNYDQISPASGCVMNTGANDQMVAIVTAKTPGQMTYKVTTKTRKC